MKKAMNGLLLLLIFVLAGCSSHTVQHYDVYEMPDNVQRWIGEKSGINGIYLGKLNEEDIIYIYMNLSNIENGEMLKFKSVSMSWSKNDKKMLIEAVPSIADSSYEKVFSIADTKRIKEIYINEDFIIKKSDIELISTDG